MTRPKGERISPEDVVFIEGADDLLANSVPVSMDGIIFAYILEKSKKGELTSRRMLMDAMKIGRTSIKKYTTILEERGVIKSKWAKAQTGHSVTVLPFFVATEYSSLLETKKIKKPKRKNYLWTKES